jgi:hypothetical protein
VTDTTTPWGSFLKSSTLALLACILLPALCGEARMARAHAPAAKVVPARADWIEQARALERQRDWQGLLD